MILHRSQRGLTDARTFMIPTSCCASPRHYRRARSLCDQCRYCYRDVRRYAAL